jgi:ABC-2 type transport system ATP-binding protein
VSDRAIQVRGLRKSYGQLEAIRGVDLDITTGECFALLGPNGAGKTTTVEILEGYRKRSAGDVNVLGFDPQKRDLAYRQRIGVVLQETGVERFLTVSEVIEMYRGFYPNPLALDDIIEVVGLTEKRSAMVRRLSGGQRRRLDVAVGLAGNPELLFLDEPTTGFDPAARRNAWNMISNLKSLGKTVFLTTHYMDEAQSLADRVAIISRGVIVAEGPPRALAGEGVSGTRVSFSLPPDAPSLPADIAGNFSLLESRWQTETERPLRLLHDLTGWALEQGVTINELQVSQPQLEDVYLELTAAAGDGESAGSATSSGDSEAKGR